MGSLRGPPSRFTCWPHLILQDSQGRGMAGELWSPPARFRSWLHCLTLGDPGRLPPCLSFRSYEVGIIIPASQEATGARSLSHVKDAGGAIVTQ